MAPNWLFLYYEMLGNRFRLIFHSFIQNYRIFETKQKLYFISMKIYFLLILITMHDWLWLRWWWSSWWFSVWPYYLYVCVFVFAVLPQWIPETIILIFHTHTHTHTSKPKLWSLWSLMIIMMMANNTLFFV